VISLHTLCYRIFKSAAYTICPGALKYNSWLLQLISAVLSRFNRFGIHLVWWIFADRLFSVFCTARPTWMKQLQNSYVAFISVNSWWTQQKCSQRGTIARAIWWLGTPTLNGWAVTFGTTEGPELVATNNFQYCCYCNVAKGSGRSAILKAVIDGRCMEKFLILPQPDD